jgi:Holliday junction resolvase RusA-like endonuclease
MRPRVSFFAAGVPASQGSKRLVRVRNSNRSIMLESSERVKPWRQTIAAVAQMHAVPMHSGDVEMHIVCRWPRPQSHLRADGTVRDSAPARPSYADVDKLARAVCDALAGIAYRNDRQVASLSIQRVWARAGESAGAHIEIIDISGKSKKMV